MIINVTVFRKDINITRSTLLGLKEVEFANYSSAATNIRDVFGQSKGEFHRCYVTIVYNKQVKDLFFLPLLYVYTQFAKRFHKNNIVGLTKKEFRRTTGRSDKVGIDYSKRTLIESQFIN